MKTVFGILVGSLFLSCSFMIAQVVEKESDGIIVVAPQSICGIKQVKLKVWDEQIIQVISSPTNEFSKRESVIITGTPKLSTDWKVSENGDQVRLSTNSLTAAVNKKNLEESFFDMHGQRVLTESGKEIHGATVVSEECYHIKQSFLCGKGERLYGLGSFQDADVALNGKKIDLLQKNRDDVVPVIISTNHYGLLWDNYSF